MTAIAGVNPAVRDGPDDLGTDGAAACLCQCSGCPSLSALPVGAPCRLHLVYQMAPRDTIVGIRPTWDARWI